MNFIFGDEFEVGAGSAAGLIGPENFLCPQGLSGYAFGEERIHGARLALFDSIANPELTVFQQPDETASETQEATGANDEGLQKLIEIGAGTELGRDLK